MSKGLKLLWLLYLFFILEVIIAVTLSRLKISIKQKLSPKESSSMNSPCGSLCFECSLFPNFIGIDFLITLQPEAFIWMMDEDEGDDNEALFFEFWFRIQVGSRHFFFVLNRKVSLIFLQLCTFSSWWFREFWFKFRYGNQRIFSALKYRYF